MGAKRFFQAAALFLLFFQGAVALAQTEPEKVKAFDQYAAQAIRQWEAPGISIAVVKDGKVLLQKGYGVRKLGETAPVDAQTIFGICSTTKAMTAAAMGMLVDEGKVNWDDPVTKYLPEFKLSDPYATQAVRVRDLFTHNAGLPNADYLWYANLLSSEQIVERMQYIPLAYPLRGGYTYQNVMYLVAGQLIAQVSGMSWADFLQKRIFTPLNMKRTFATMEASKGESNRSTPHYRVKGKVVPIRDMAVDRVGPAGSVWSCAEDMAKWMLFVLDSAKVNGQRLLKPETHAEWLKPQTIVPPASFYPTVRLTKPMWTTYALGWFQHDYQGKAVSFHTGSMDGTIAIIGLIPAEKLGIYVLGNLDHAEVRHALMYRAFDQFGAGGDPTRDWSKEFLELYGGLEKQATAASEKAEKERVLNTKPSLPLADYAGNYSHPLYGKATVSLGSDGRLVVKGNTAESAYNLDHWHFDTFKGVSDRFWEEPSLVQFQLGADGKVSAMRLEGAEWMKKE